LAVYLLLFSASSYQHSPKDGVWGMLQEERMYPVPVSDTDKLRLRLVVKWAKFQQSLVYDATDQWQKRLEARIHTEGGHFEHFL